jgi:chromosome partitioning protein
MPAYQPFLRFLVSLQGKLLARLLDSDMYVRAVESGIGIFEMDPGQTQVERRQFAPIVDWVTGEQTPVPAAEQVYELPQIRRVSL